jgi:hypothetical protein
MPPQGMTLNYIEGVQSVIGPVVYAGKLWLDLGRVQLHASKGESHCSPSG